MRSQKGSTGPAKTVDMKEAEQNDSDPATQEPFVAPDHMDAEGRARKDIANAKRNANKAMASPEQMQAASAQKAEEPDSILVSYDRSAEREATTEPVVLDSPRTKGASLLQLYTPSSMLSWGQFEVKYFQQLYTQTAFFNGNGNTVEAGNRSNYYSGIFNFTLGYNSRLNFGFDAWIQSVYIDGESRSPFRLFTFPGGTEGRTALTAIGPKVKWQPIGKLNNFTLQSSLLLPVANDPEGRMNGRPFLATENFLWWTQIFYTWNFHERAQLFTELDVYWNIDRSFDFERSGFLALPMSAFLSYFPTDKITVYIMNQLWPTLGEGLVSSHWYQAAVGGKYQFSKSVDLELMYGRFLGGRNAAGPATTFNLGLRFVKW